MLDVTLKYEDSEHYIKDILQEENGIKITYGDDKEEIDPQPSLHNMNCYRYRMQEQFRKYAPKYEIKLGVEIIKNRIKKYLSIILDATAIYFNVTYNPNTLLKIIATILLVVGELGYLFLNKVGEYYLDQYEEEILTTEYYLENQNIFEYYSEGLQEFRHLIPIEQISRLKLTKEDLVRVKQMIEKYKQEKISLDEMQIALTKQPTK